MWPQRRLTFQDETAPKRLRSCPAKLLLFRNRRDLLNSNFLATANRQSITYTASTVISTSKKTKNKNGKSGSACSKTSKNAGKRKSAEQIYSEYQWILFTKQCQHLHLITSKKQVFFPTQNIWIIYIHREDPEIHSHKISSLKPFSSCHYLRIASVNYSFGAFLLGISRKDI